MLSMFRTFIDNGCYIHGTYNEKHVPLKWTYEIEDYNHDFLVIGYDYNFYYAGFVADGRFRHFKIPNQKFIDAVSNTGSFRVDINFFSYNEEVISKPNIIDKMLSVLEKYISTANYLDNPTPSAISYGISTLMSVREFFVYEVVNNRKLYVHKRYSRVLYEHEWVFTQVIDAFLDSKEKIEFINLAKK